MFLYDSLSQKKKRVEKPGGGPLKLFVCGPTVYDYAHIGHARTYLTFDTLVRYLRHRGFKVSYLQNITDIDDKIINRALLAKKPPRAIAQFFEKEYLNNMKALGITSVDRYARASAYLKEIKKQIRQLIKKGFAYQTASGVYFEVKKFKDYGRLSQQDLAKLRPGWRIDPDPEKKDPLDFALWKRTPAASQLSTARGQRLVFASPWGPGRPGWHIEDTAITEKFFGPQYDIHGAAVDLKFPHHESEIAQQEAASGKTPFVKIWVHIGFLLVNNQKMSKSLRNFITISQFLKGHSANVLRLLVLGHHYRSPINYTSRLAHQYQNSLANIEKFFRTIALKKAGNETKAFLEEKEREWRAALDNDFNTPEALAILFAVMAQAPKTTVVKKWLAGKLAVLGIKIKAPAIPVNVRQLLKQRQILRQKEQFSAADQLRKKIGSLGLLIED